MAVEHPGGSFRSTKPRGLSVYIFRFSSNRPRSGVVLVCLSALLTAGLTLITAHSAAVAVTTCTGMGTLSNGSFELDNNGTSGAAFSGTGFDSKTWSSYAHTSYSSSNLKDGVQQILDVLDTSASSPGIQGWLTTESDKNIEIQRVYIGPEITVTTAATNDTSTATTNFTAPNSNGTPFTGQAIIITSGFTGTYNSATKYVVSAGATSATTPGTTFQVSGLTLSGTGKYRIVYTSSSTLDGLSLGNNPNYDDSTPTPFSGTYEAEINANAASTLFQNLTTVPGTTIRWSLRHAARKMSESMYVVIGSGADSSGSKLDTSTVKSTIPTIFSATSGSPYQGISASTAISQVKPGGTTTITSGGAMTDAVAAAADRAAGNASAWTLYRGAYTVPSGNANTYTYFGFQSTTDSSVGNLLDDIQFTPVAACPLTNTLTTNSQITLDPFTCVALSQCAASSNSTGPALAPNPEGGATRTVTASVASGGGSVSTSGENVIFTAPGTVGTSVVNYTIDYNADGIDSQSTGTITYTVTAASGLSGCVNASTSTSYPGNDVVVTLKDSLTTNDATCNWTVPVGVYAVNYLVIGGGGGGGSGGGGAGQMVTSWPCTTVVASCSNATPLSVTPGTVIPLVIGHGGAHGVGGEAVTSSFNTLVSTTQIQAYSGSNSQFGASVIARGGGAGGVPYRQYFCSAQSSCPTVNITDLPPTGYGPYFGTNGYTGQTLEGINYGFSGSQNGMGAGDSRALGSGGGAGYDTVVPSATGNTSSIVGATSFVSQGGIAGGTSNTAGGGGGGAAGNGGNASGHSGGAGGLAKLNSLTGASICYAGGGGAGYQDNNNSSTANGGGSGGYCSTATADEVGGHGSDFGTCATVSCGSPGGSHAVINSGDSDRTPGNSLPGLDGYPDTGSGGGGTDPDDLLAGNGSNGVVILRWTPQNSACPYNAATVPATYPIACPAAVNVYAGSSASINVKNAPISYADNATTLSVVSTPSGLTQSANSNSGVITVSVSSPTSPLIGGTYPITYQLTSGSNIYTSYLNVTVLDPNQHSPIVIPIDPRTTSSYLPTILLGNTANVHFCVSQLNSDYSNQILISAPSSTGVTQIATGTQLILEGANSAVASLMSQILLSPGPGDTYLIPGTAIRTIQTNVSSTDTGNANCTNGTTQTIQITPYGLIRTIVQQQTDLGHHR